MPRFARRRSRSALVWLFVFSNTFRLVVSFLFSSFVGVFDLVLIMQLILVSQLSLFCSSAELASRRFCDFQKTSLEYTRSLIMFDQEASLRYTHPKFSKSLFGQEWPKGESEKGVWPQQSEKPTVGSDLTSEQTCSSCCTDVRTAGPNRRVFRVQTGCPYSGPDPLCKLENKCKNVKYENYIKKIYKGCYVLIT